MPDELAAESQPTLPKDFPDAPEVGHVMISSGFFPSLRTLLGHGGGELVDDSMDAAVPRFTWAHHQRG